MSTRRIGVAVSVVAFAIIIVATLTPSEGGEGTPMFCWLCGDRGLADALLNVALFLPLGVGLRMSGLRPRSIALFALALTTTIELAQFALIRGRDSSPADVVYNTLGVVIGSAMAARMRSALFPAPALSRRLTLIGATTVALVALLTALLIRPSVPRSTEYWGEWTPDHGRHVAQYSGELLRASVGSLPVSRGKYPNAEMLKRELQRQSPIQLRFSAGRADPPTGVAPIFDIMDQRQREVFMVGALADDIVVSWRCVSKALRLDCPSYRLETGTNENIIDLSVTRTRSHIEARINGRDQSLRVGPAIGWSLLWFNDELSSKTVRTLSMVWLILLVLPVAYWSGIARKAGLAAGLLVLAIGVVPTAAGLSLLSAAEAAAVAVAFLAAFAAARPVRQTLSRAVETR